MAEHLPGWYVDAIEQNLGTIIAKQRTLGLSVDELVELLSDPQVRDGSDSVLDHDDHMQTLAICLALCVSRLARVDMPA